MFCSPYPSFHDGTGYYMIIPFTLIFATLACLGNIFVFGVIMRHEPLRSQSAYKFIASLNIADILVGISAQPLYTTVIIIGSNKNCWIERAAHFVGSISSAASGVGLVCVSMDRYFYITKPMHYQEIMSEKRVTVALIYPWTLAIFSAFMPYITGIQAFHAFLFGAMILNTFVIAFFYMTIFKVIKGRITDQIAEKSKSFKKRQTQATRTIAFVVLAYMFCWFPYVTVAFIWSLNAQNYSSDSSIVNLYYWTLALGHWNSALNVMIYSWKNTELREAMKKYLGFRREGVSVSVSFGNEQSEENV